eukprot:COSAG01_NODE_5050_length_4524_cov_189.554802_2_plen_124_part_00
MLHIVPPETPTWIFGDWNFVQNQDIDEINRKPKAKNIGLDTWKSIARDIGLVELLDKYGGTNRSRTELTWTPFETTDANGLTPVQDSRGQTQLRPPLNNTLCSPTSADGLNTSAACEKMARHK